MTSLFNNNCRKVISAGVCLVLLMITTSFSVLPTNHIKKDNWLPEGFNPKDGILLIQEHPFGARQNERMVAFLDKEYHWRYEIISINQMQQNKKYQDKKLYQFAMLWTDMRSRENTTEIRGLIYNDIDGHFLDRNTDTEYPQSKLGKGFGQIGYRKVINAINKKFKDSE